MQLSTKIVIMLTARLIVNKNCGHVTAHSTAHLIQNRDMVTACSVMNQNRDHGNSMFNWNQNRCLLFNDGHVLQLWSETVTVRTRIT